MTLLPALALSALLSAEPEPSLPFERVSPWELGAIVGGGWDSNPLASIEEVDSAFFAARAWVARELGPSQDELVWLQLRYDGTWFTAPPDAGIDPADANLDRAELTLEWGHYFTDALTLRTIGYGALRAAGGPGRSGWDAGGRALLRLRLHPAVAVRVGGGYVHREADDAAYTTSTGWFEGGLDASLWRGASMLARYTLGLGTDTVFGTTGGGYRGGGGMGEGGMGGEATLGENEIVQGLSADLRQDLGRGLFLQAGYGVSFVRSWGTLYVEHQVIGEVGWSR
jgi:hypothetical protein